MPGAVRNIYSVLGKKVGLKTFHFLKNQFTTAINHCLSFLFISLNRRYHRSMISKMAKVMCVCVTMKISRN